MLPAALDGELCRRARDHMWSVLSAEVPRLRRADPQTWGPIEPDEPTGASRLPGASEAACREGTTICSVRMEGSSVASAT